MAVWVRDHRYGRVPGKKLGIPSCSPINQSPRSGAVAEHLKPARLNTWRASFHSKPWDAQPVKNADASSSDGLQSHTPGLEDCLIRLVMAMQEQTAAISQLAQSNEMLAQVFVQAMAEEQGMEDAPVSTYLNGKPR